MTDIYACLCCGGTHETPLAPAMDEELARVVPNLIVSQGPSVSGNSSAGAYFIRGIGQIDFLLNTDPGVGLYVDGVYVARSVARSSTSST